MDQNMVEPSIISDQVAQKSEFLCLRFQETYNDSK